MEKPQYLRLQPGKAVVARMAATILTGFVQQGQLREDNEHDLAERAMTLAIKLANRTEALVTSDEEFTRQDSGSSFLVA